MLGKKVLLTLLFMPLLGVNSGYCYLSVSSPEITFVDNYSYKRGKITIDKIVVKCLFERVGGTVKSKNIIVQNPSFYVGGKEFKLNLIEECFPKKGATFGLRRIWIEKIELWSGKKLVGTRDWPPRRAKKGCSSHKYFLERFCRFTEEDVATKDNRIGINRCHIYTFREMGYPGINRCLKWAYRFL